MKRIILLSSLFVFLWQCIGEDFIDDYVAPSLRISNPILRIRKGLNYQFQAQFFDESGTKIVNPNFNWTISPTSNNSIQEDGTFTALTPGTVTLTVSTKGLRGNILTAAIQFTVTAPPDPVAIESNAPNLSTATLTTENTVSDTTATTATESPSIESSDEMLVEETIVSTLDEGIVFSEQFFEGPIRSTSSYLLEGNYRLEHTGQNIILRLDESYRADTALPGLYVYLTNNPATPLGGFEIGMVTVFEGAHQYSLPDTIALMDFKYILYWCKPFSVKVGDAQIFED
ncbi:MAG: hypothetical protein ACON47_10230 [Flavobacteriaceae bacterium]